MSYVLTKTYPRLWSLENGRVMVVSDLHGDWDAYQRCRDRFVALQARAQIDCLIFTGDLIHAESETELDKSVDIVADVLDLQSAYGSAVVYLCGNHEMPHIYGISLARGRKEYTAAFEATLSWSGCRTEVLALFDSLPFFVRTRAGISLAHAGASPAMLDSRNAARLFNWNHQELLGWAEQSLAQEDAIALRRAFAKLNQVASYEALAKHYLAVSGPNDPRYDDLLRGFLATAAPSFDLLWSALFTRCEEEYGQDNYAIFLDATLKELSVDYSAQEVLVSGHMKTQRGHKVVAGRQLRLSSAWHARPRRAGEYLLFDAAEPIHNVEALLANLHNVYED
jgi:predicted MPP superfamily phosphohydrolase